MSLKIAHCDLNFYLRSDAIKGTLKKLHAQEDPLHLYQSNYDENIVVFLENSLFHFYFCGIKPQVTFSQTNCCNWYLLFTLSLNK